MAVPAAEFTLDMIQSWAGEGSNRAALVIQWNDEREKNALVFGYRWDGVATGADMIKAVIEANPRLYGLIQYTNVSSPADPWAAIPSTASAGTLTTTATLPLSMKAITTPDTKAKTVCSFIRAGIIRRPEIPPTMTTTTGRTSTPTTSGAPAGF